MRKNSVGRAGSFDTPAARDLCNENMAIEWQTRVNLEIGDHKFCEKQEDHGIHLYL